MTGNKKNFKFLKKIFVIIVCILSLVFLYINIVSSNKNKQAINSIINLEQYNDFEFYDILPKLKVLDDNKKVIERYATLMSFLINCTYHFANSFLLLFDYNNLVGFLTK